MKSLNTVRTSTVKVTRWSRLRSRITSLYSRITLVLLLMFGCSISLQAQEQEIDSIQRAELWKDPNFVRAYYVVVEPGGALYSVFGHACLHMVCPAYGYDYFYSYESEDAASRLLTFFAGNLKMGMVAMTAEEYLSGYEKEGRGAREYELNLPIDEKRELWRVLDEKVVEGMYLPYDFEVRGCAQACVTILEETLGKTQIEYGAWSPRFDRTRREIANDFAHLHYPWDFLLITSVVGAEYDQVDTITEKLLIPSEVAEVWQNAKYNGEYLLSHDSHELLPSIRKQQTPWLTPMMVALLILVMAIIAFFIRKPYIDWLVLTIVTLIGTMVSYLVFFSTLPCTNWSWLIVPFNLLPALGWKWRRFWALSYSIMIGIWVMGMLISPHQLVDYSMIVLAIAFMLILMNKRNNKLSLIAKKA